MKTRIFNNKLKGLIEECSACKDASKMTSNGFLHKDEDVNDWFIEFVCDKSGEICFKWKNKYEPLIQEVLKEEGITE